MRWARGSGASRIAPVLGLFHPLLVWTYLLLPPAALVLAIFRAQRTALTSPLVSLVVTAFAGAMLGFLAVLANGFVLDGAIPLSERLWMSYLGISVALVLAVADRFLRLSGRALRRGVRVVWAKVCCRDAPATAMRPTYSGLLAQRLLLLAIGVPYVAGLLIVYRPKAPGPAGPPDGHPHAQVVSFTATDGVRLEGWWLPAPPAGTSRNGQWGGTTVVLCHGITASRGQHRALASDLLAAGFNVLTFDFRGHGRSGGRLATFGDRERRDVLGAVRWIRANHPQQAQRLCGVGFTTGAAALLAAAADGVDGQHIDAVVLFEPYADLGQLSVQIIDDVFPGWFAALMRGPGLFLASVHAGSNLRRFSPQNLAEQLWPRPMLVVHGRGRSFVPTSHTMGVYQQALQPKQQYFPDPGLDALRRPVRSQRELYRRMLRQWLGRLDAVDEDAACRHRAVRFLLEAQRFPVL